MTMRERFTEEEWTLVRHVPFDAFMFGALADKKVEDAEVEAFTETLEKAAALKDVLHREIALDWVAGGLPAMGEELRFEMTESIDAMRSRFDKTKGILQDKLTRDEYQSFVVSVTINGMAVAAASSSKKGLFHKKQRISEEEAAALSAFAVAFDVDLGVLQARIAQQ